MKQEQRNKTYMKKKILNRAALLTVALTSLVSLGANAATVCGFAAYSQVTANGCPGEGGCTRTTYYDCFSQQLTSGACGLFDAPHAVCVALGSISMFTVVETTACEFTYAGDTCSWPALFTTTTDCSSQMKYNSETDPNCH